MGDVSETLRCMAERYEKESFLDGDPSWFMHQVDGNENRELVAFVASTLSYGSRKQFMPKIQYLVDCGRSAGSFRDWISTKAYEKDIPCDENKCFYRLYTYATMNRMFAALQEMLEEYGSMRGFMTHGSCGGMLTGLEAVERIVSFFAARNIEGIIPKNTKSSCKRICMFLRWMVRKDSPVDIGIWSDIVDCKTLIMPMDTHVLQEANRLGLLGTKSASMSSAMKLTRRLLSVFPDDPLKGDFALFGMGVAEAE